MNDTKEFEDVVAQLRAGLEPVRFDHPFEAPRRRRRSGWAGFAALTIVLLIAFLNGGVEEKFAWAATSRPPTAEEQASINKDCADTVSTRPSDATGSSSWPPLMVSEVRGDMITSTFAGGGWFVTCVVEDRNRSGRIVNLVQWGAENELPEGKGPLRFASMGFMPERAPGTYFITGRAGPEIANVIIVVAKLGQVEASHSEGWFQAWWPSQEPFVVKGLDSFGKVVVEVPVP